MASQTPTLSTIERLRKLFAELDAKAGSSTTDPAGSPSTGNPTAVIAHAAPDSRTISIDDVSEDTFTLTPEMSETSGEIEEDVSDAFNSVEEAECQYSVLACALKVADILARSYQGKGKSKATDPFHPQSKPTKATSDTMKDKYNALFDGSRHRIPYSAADLISTGDMNDAPISKLLNSYAAKELKTSDHSRKALNEAKVAASPKSFPKIDTAATCNDSRKACPPAPVNKKLGAGKDVTATQNKSGDAPLLEKQATQSKVYVKAYNDPAVITAEAIKHLKGFFITAVVVSTGFELIAFRAFGTAIPERRANVLAPLLILYAIRDVIATGISCKKLVKKMGEEDATIMQRAAAVLLFIGVIVIEIIIFSLLAGVETNISNLGAQAHDAAHLVKIQTQAH